MIDFLKKNIEKLIIAFIIAQPIIDCLTAVSMNVLHLDITFGIIIRIGFLLFLIAYNLCTKSSSKRFKLYIFLAIGYFILFTANVLLTKDISCLFYELKNIARYFYFPMLLLNLYELNQKRPLEIPLKIMVETYMIYIILILIPLLTHTDFSGYYEGKVGTIGWFHATNEISAIVSGLLPCIIIYSKNLPKLCIFLLPIIIVFFSLGSKITIATLFIVLLYYLCLWLWKHKNKKKLMLPCSIALIALICLSIYLVPKTSFYKNIRIHLDFLEVEHITDIFRNPKHIDHFIFSSRLTFLKNTHQNYIKSGLSSKLLGLGFIENYGTDQVNLKTIEMDVFDIFYRTGILGSLLFLLPLYWIVLAKKRKRTKNNSISLILFLFISLLAGHVLTSPAVSIYLCLLILCLIKEEQMCKQQ